MKVSFTKPFKRDYKKLPGNIQELIDKQITYLLENPKHPSLQIKKMEGHPFIWEARITKGYRMTLQIDGDTCLLRRVGTHSILKTP
ncbi:MAG: type II toxin-antitoxin system RelE/ParE family toxin [Thermodesulfovibrionales bacterium]|nr:type II toxin-antitoxin system RelE/ParE family toxin [Thermodesulfovibrionales bacterium]